MIYQTDPKYLQLKVDSSKNVKRVHYNSFITKWSHIVEELHVHRYNSIVV